jgi:hypothetical protein
MSKVSAENVIHVYSSSYLKGDLKSNGFVLRKANNDRINYLCGSIKSQVENLDFFNVENKNRCIRSNVFDGDAASKKVQPGRYIMHLNTFQESKLFSSDEKNCFIYEVNNLHSELIEELVKLDEDVLNDGPFNFNVLQSVAELLDGPQVVHVDDDYESTNNFATYFCIVATTNCQVCVMKGSHKYKHYKDFVSDNMTFSIPVVCNLTAGERLYCHIKLFHCGWGCGEQDNFRLFYLLNKHHDSHHARVLHPDIVKVYDGFKQQQHRKQVKQTCLMLNNKKRALREQMLWRFTPKVEKQQLVKKKLNIVKRKKNPCNL